MAILFSKAFQKLGLIDVVDLPLFKPNSAGSRSMMYHLTKQSVNNTIPLLGQLIKEVQSHDEPKILTTSDFCDTNGQGPKEDIEELRKTLESYGSDKSTVHDYYLVYASILKDRNKVSGILEIGMGSNNTDVASNMGASGKPGASLRSFRDFLPNAKVCGADIDQNILFEEDRIETFFVDQTDMNTLRDLGTKVPDNLDLIIDDGLHAPDANLNTLMFALNHIDPKSGFVVIEDIPESAVPLWKAVSYILDKDYVTYIVKTKLSYMFICAPK